MRISKIIFNILFFILIGGGLPINFIFSSEPTGENLFSSGASDGNSSAVTPLIFAAQPLAVVINEIAWMGTETSYNDEWIELYNNTSQDISLDGWELKAEDESPKINLTGIIPADGFYILERTDDEALPKILANLIYKGSLENSGENLRIYNSDGNLTDSVDCSGGWFAGDNETKQTMERKNTKVSGNDSNNWQTSQNPDGTSGAKNSEQKTINSEQTETPETEQQVIKSQNETTLKNKILLPEPVYPSGIIFNEIIPSPEGPDDLEEWIELKNINNEEVNLSKWKIQDTTGSIITYTFPEGAKIGPFGFLILSRPTTKITLNNSGDGLNLLQPNGNILDAVTFQKAPKGQSYNRDTPDTGAPGWIWSNILTPGLENITTKTTETNKSNPEQPTEQISNSGNKEKTEELKPNPLKETSAEETKSQLAAAVSEGFFPLNKFLTILLTAFGIAIFSGVTILLLKGKLKTRI